MSVGEFADGVRVVVRMLGPCSNTAIQALMTQRSDNTLRGTFLTAHEAANKIRLLGNLESARRLVAGAYVQFGADGPVSHMIMSTAFGLHPQPAYAFEDFADEIEEAADILTPMDAGKASDDTDEASSVSADWDLASDADELAMEMEEMVMC